MIVLDTSAAIPWFMPDEESELSERAQAYISLHGAVVPSLWHLEIRNALLSAVRRRRIPEEQLTAGLAFLPALQMVTDDEIDLERVVALAMMHGLSAYDAAYLELALRLRLPLVTLDRKLGTATRAAGVTLFA